METYADTGLVRYEYNHFAFLGNESRRAAEAAECANELEQFWPYHDTIYLNQRGENLGAFSDDNLRNFAIAMGLDEEAFNDCFNSGRYRTAVATETAESGELGVQSTPSFRINGELIASGLTIEQFQSLIQAQLGASQ